MKTDLRIKHKKNPIIKIQDPLILRLDYDAPKIQKNEVSGVKGLLKHIKNWVDNNGLRKVTMFQTIFSGKG